MTLMKFQDMAYKRPDLEVLYTALEQAAEQAAKAENGQALVAVYDQVTDLTVDMETAATLAEIRHSIDTEDEFYNAEQDFFDENMPMVSVKLLAFSKAVMASPYKEALTEKYGPVLLQKVENSVKSMDDRLVTLKQEENALETAYQKLYASARIPFEGKEYTVAQMGPFTMSTDRARRKAAFTAVGSFFDSKQEELDSLYSKMVENRTRQGEIMGFSSFTPLGDLRLCRLGYGREEIHALREAVAQHIVPYVVRLKEAQAARIGVAKLRVYDEPLSFPDGNPTPKGTPEEILAAGREMYRGLSAETAEFIDFMMDNDLFDVLAKPGKAPGGYCTIISKYKSPFIFSNFNGTSGDVDVLTHEAGHAFAFYRGCVNGTTPDLMIPGMESAEIHSMSMEFLTDEYHSLFFKEDTEKYAVAHAEDALFFLPYGCQVDEFQECVYENPSMTPAQRNTLWLELDKKYRPWIDNDSLPFYSRGAVWQRQMHIYSSPFYYIDYVLAQSVALNFYMSHKKDKADTWQRYLALVNKSGTETYPQLVHAAGFKTPYEGDTLQMVGKETYEWVLAQTEK